MELINRFFIQGFAGWIAHVLIIGISLSAAFFGTRAALKKKTVWSAAAAPLSAAFAVLVVFYVFALDAHIPSDPALFLFAAFVFWSGTMLAIIFGFSGLQEIASSESASGRRYAWTGLILGIFLPFLLLHAAAVSIRTGFPMDAYKNLQERFKGVNAEDAQGEQGKTEDGYKNFPEYNFRFKIPGEPWTEFDYRAFDPMNKLGYMQMNTQMNFSIGVHTGVNIDPSKLDALVDTTTQIVKNGMPDGKVSNERDWTTASGLKGKRLELEGTVNGLYLRYQWLFLLRPDGNYYSLLMWQPKNLEDADYSPTFEEMLNRFEITSGGQGGLSGGSAGTGGVGGSFGGSVASASSGSRTSPGPNSAPSFSGPQKFSEDYESSLGYKVKAKNSGWLTWPDVRASIEFADFGMIQEPVAFFASPSFFFDHQPSLDAYAQTALGMVGIDFSRLPAGSLKKISKNGYEGYEISHEHSAKQFFYQIKILKGKDRGFFLGAVQNLAESAKDDKRLRDAVERFEPVKNPPPVKEEELEVKVRENSGLTLNQIGLNHYLRNNKEEALNYFRTALRLFPDHDTVFENYIKVLMETGRHEEANKALQNSPGRSKSNASLGIEQAKVLYEIGKKDEAIKKYKELLKENPESGELIEAYAEALWEMEKRDEALKVVEEKLKSSNSVSLKILYSHFLAQSDKADEAVAQAKKAHEEFPGYEPARQNLYNLLSNLGRFEEMREVSKKEIESGKADFYSYMYSGMSQYELTSYRDAQEAFDKALTFNSQDPMARKYAEELKQMLGYVNLDEVEQKLEPVVIPDHLQNVSTKPPAGHDTSYYSKHITAFLVEPGKPLKKTVYKSIHVQSAHDLARYVEMEFKYDSMNEQLFVNKIEVRDNESKIIGGADISKFYIVDDSDAGFASYNKVLHAPVSGVAVGATIDVVFTVQDKNPHDFFYEEIIFGSTLPVTRETAVVTGQTQGVSAVVSNGPVFSEKDGFKIWSMDNIPAFKTQGNAPEYDSYLPILRLGSKGDGWVKEGEEYLDLIEGELKPDTRVDQLAQRLVQGAASPEEKIERIFRYVQDEYSYNAIEFGLRAMVPHGAGRILDQKYGDCKDHSVILRQLLLSAGIPANLVLVRAEGNIEPELVSLEQFDHMIVYCPLYKKNPFLDATQKTLDPGLLGFGLPRKKGLVLERGASKLLDMNMTPVMDSKIDSSRVISFEGNDLKVEDTLTFRGYSASLLRDFLREVPANEQTQQFQDGFFKGRRVSVKDIETLNLNDRTKPLILKLKYEADNVLFYIGENLTGELPAFWEEIHFNLKYEKDRQAPFEFYYPETITSHVTFKTPEGYSLEPRNFPQGLSFSSKYISLKGDLKVTPEGFMMNSEMTQPAGVFPASEFSGATEETKKSLEILRFKIVLTPKKN